jgi:competence ComEA-like helix-hairpin-helix protein
VALYTRQQLVLLVLLVAAAAAGLAVREWRTAYPELADRLEQLDRQRPNATEPPREVRTPREATTSERPLDLNRATPDELTTLPGVGLALALRIVQARETGGRFASVDDLRRVKGLTVTRLERLRPLLTVAE